MRFSKRTLTTALGATALSTLLMTSAMAQTVNITILGVGDIYNFDAEDGRGGMARLNAVALAERAA
ncbi:MAG: bifunctional metallophosphatase/5'-nucleotidase, partial [Hyphomicrobiaceae bacterium]|nr:bifunctional metallophosphatase/5'-nucleotidase [Hyphomicrobiaceae bacterium]